VTVRVTELLGRAEDPRFAAHRHVALTVAWDEASRSRLRRTAEDGTDVIIDLASAEYLADGAVLHDDGERALVVKRALEPALIVRFDTELAAARLIEQAAAIGHALGNQHIPLDIAPGELRAPVTSNETIARATVDALKLEGVTCTIADVALGREQPLAIGHAHRPKAER
jgi:urease accessory protein